MKGVSSATYTYCQKRPKKLALRFFGDNFLYFYFSIFVMYFVVHLAFAGILTYIFYVMGFLHYYYAFFVGVVTHVIYTVKDWRDLLKRNGNILLADKFRDAARGFGYFILYQIIYAIVSSFSMPFLTYYYIYYYSWFLSWLGTGIATVSAALLGLSFGIWLMKYGEVEKSH